MNKDSTISLTLRLLVALLPLSCHLVKQGPSTSSVQADDFCSGEPINFLELPLDCQQNIISKLSDKELVRFAKAVSKQTSKVGFGVLLNRAKTSVPESLQLEIEAYVSRFRHCVDSDQSAALRSHPIFLERLITHYLAYVKLMNNKYPKNYDWRHQVPFRIGRIWVPSRSAPIVLDNRNIVYLKSEDQALKTSLEIRDSVTFKVKSTQILEPVQVSSDANALYPLSLQALGPQSFFLVREPEQRKTLWTYKTNVWKKHQTFSSDVKIFSVKDQNLFFTIEKGQLIQYALNGEEFQAKNLGTFPTLPNLHGIATKSDQLISFETFENTSYLKIWDLSRQNIRLKNSFKYEGEYRAPTLHKRNILSFISVKNAQYSYILFDTAGSKQLLEIPEPLSYGSPNWNHKLTFINEKTFAIMQVAESKAKYEGHLVSVPTWGKDKYLGSFGKSNFPFMAPYDGSYFVYYGDALSKGGRLMMRSVENINRYFEVLPVDSKFPPGILEPAEGAFLSINSEGFALYSPWNKVIETIQTHL